MTLKTKIAVATFVLCVGLLFLASLPSSWAHTHRVLTIGGQQVEFVVGWFVEPPYAGEVNAVDFWAHYINFTCPQGTVSTSCPIYGLDQNLRVEVATGGQSQILNFSPSLSNDVPPIFNGEYTANIEPTVPGTYSFRIFGTVGRTPINETFTCGPTTFECVDPANDIEFPQAIASSSDLQTALSNAQSQIANLQSQVAQMQSTLQTVYTIAGVSIAIGIIGVVIAALAIFRNPTANRRAQRTQKRKYKD
jgi:hypothetical protein